jgi:hypothetical protein
MSLRRGAPRLHYLARAVRTELRIARNRLWSRSLSTRERRWLRPGQSRRTSLSPWVARVRGSHRLCRCCAERRLSPHRGDFLCPSLCRLHPDTSGLIRVDRLRRGKILPRVEDAPFRNAIDRCQPRSNGRRRGSRQFRPRSLGRRGGRSVAIARGPMHARCARGSSTSVPRPRHIVEQSTLP